MKTGGTQQSKIITTQYNKIQTLIKGEIKIPPAVINIFKPQTNTFNRQQYTTARNKI
jgi:hypothetical protein